MYFEEDFRPRVNWADVSPFADPTVSDLEYAVSGELISAADVVALELERYKAGATLTDVEETLALLLRDEEHRVRDLLALHVTSAAVRVDAERFWIGVLLRAALYDSDPTLREFDAVQAIWEHFGLPDALSPYVPRMEIPQVTSDSEWHAGLAGYVVREQDWARRRGPVGDSESPAAGSAATR